MLNKIKNANCKADIFYCPGEKNLTDQTIWAQKAKKNYRPMNCVEWTHNIGNTKGKVNKTYQQSD
jgi:hypothetical protein